MSELSARMFLRALLHTGQCMARRDDDAAANALAALERATEVLLSGKSEVALTVGEEAFYLDRAMLPHASTEFNGMLRALQGQGVDSITLLSGCDRTDLSDLAGFAAGISGDFPAGGTVRLNERPLADSDLVQRPVSGLRRSYASSLDALRSASGGHRLDMGRAVDAVDALLGGGAGRAGPSLMMATVHNHDEATYYHSVNVCLLSMALGHAIGIDDEPLRFLGLGALLHDLGRVVLDDPGLTKQGRLSNADWATVRLHPQEGAIAILAAAGVEHETAALVALEHHLRPDGSGYPDLGDRSPHLYSRLVAVADAYDAITSHRPYRPARTPHEALRILLEGSATAFDADLVQAFVGMMGDFPPGSLLRLEDGEVVMVTADAAGGRSAVMVRDVAGATLEQPEPIDLAGRRIAAQLLADEVGIDPASLLEVVEAGS